MRQYTTDINDKAISYFERGQLSQAIELLDDKRFNENRKITINEVAEETGIGRATLTRIANQQGYAVGTNIIDKLCGYFNCDVSDILQRVPDNNEIKST